MEPICNIHLQVCCITMVSGLQYLQVYSNTPLQDRWSLELHITAFNKCIDHSCVVRIVVSIDSMDGVWISAFFYQLL